MKLHFEEIVELIHREMYVRNGVMLGAKAAAKAIMQAEEAAGKESKMKMVIVTKFEEMQGGEHLVSEEIYNEIALLILSRTHPEWSRPTKRALDLPHGGMLCEVVVEEDGGTKIYPIETASQ